MNVIELGPPPTVRPVLRPRAGGGRLLAWVLTGVDLSLVYAAFALAYWLRYSLQVGPRIHDYISFASYQPLALLLLGILMPTLLVKGAYRTRLGKDLFDEVAVYFSAVTISIAAIVVITAMLHQYLYSRAVIVYLWLLTILLLSSGRAFVRAIQGLAYRRGLGVRRLLVVGATDAGKMVMQSVMHKPDLGYHLVGFVDRRNVPHVRDFGRFRALGTVDHLPELITEHLVDEIIVALPAADHEEVWPILGLCEEHGVGLKLIPDLFEMSLSRVQVDDIADIPLLDVVERSNRFAARVAKRLLDIVVAAVVLLITSPLLLLLAAAIRLESDGSPFLRQKRVGLGGRTFDLYKLRTMRADAPELQPVLQTLNQADGPLFKMRDDPRCTRLGKHIRRWSLDELPNLFNVLRGDMSLVGPRPALPNEVEQYDSTHLRRLEVKPGITGLWQVRGRSDLAFDEMVMMDVYYVDSWSVGTDLKILARTVAAVLGRRGAY